MIDIFRVTGGTETVLCRVADSSASVVNELMGREEVTVNVVVESPLPVEVGDFVRIDGTVYTLNREPDFEKVSDVEYRYNLLFESPLYRMLDKLFTNPLTGISKFSVSRTLSEFVRLLTENMNKIDSGWSVSGDIPASEPKNLTFDAVSCREVLNRLSGEFGAEYFLTGKTIHFTERIENKTDLVFEQGKGKGLYSIGQEPVDSENTVTRIFPYGGTQNMAPGKGDASGRLFLPEGYLENFTEYGKVVEKEVEFQDVFPRFTGSADSVSGEFNNVVRCSSINFDVEKQGVGDTKVKINFLSGDLMGESFEFGWNNTNKEVTLIRKEDETALPGKDGKRPLIPHALKKAKSGDSFNFTDLLMPDEYMASAIVDLRAKATEWLAYYSRSRVKYSLEVDHRYLRGKRTLKAGDLVTIKIPEIGTEKLLRIVSAERNLNTGKLSCTVSNYLDEKWSKKIEGAISDLKSNVTGSGSGGGLKIDILKENDLTPASDLNIYSSKRSVKEIGDKLSRVKADSAEGHITFKKGAAVEGGTVTDTLTASGKVVASDMEAGNNIKSKTAEVSEKSVAGTLQVKGSATASDMEIANHIKTKTVEVTGKAHAGDLEVTGNAKLSSLNVSGKTVTGTIDVAGLSKSGNAEVVNLSQTKDLEVAELARIRDLVVTRLAEVLNLSVTDVATLARTIVKESISSGTFIPGFAGEGFKIWQLAGGDWTGEFDSITIRKTLTAFELLISKIRAVNGSLAITQANGKIKKVLDQSPVYSLEIDETMSFSIGDLVRCQTWQSTGSKYYWVTVVRVEGNSIICNQAEFNGVVPAVGDELVQMGHVSDPFRQSMVYLDASSGRPSIDVLSGINTKSFAGKLKVRLGCLEGITDTDFPSDMQPSGYGLYCTNGFFKGMFVLRSGKTVEDYAGGLVDAIQVGGRNLVKNSKMNLSAISDNPYTFTTFPLCEPIKSNTTYAFSIEKTEIVSGSATDFFTVIAYSPSGVKDYGHIAIPISQNKQQGIYITPDVLDDCIFLLYSGVAGNSQDRKLRWTGLKIEEGNKATAWTPAPEDVDAAIETAQDAASQAQSDANTANGAITRIDTKLSALPGEITAAVTKTTTAYTDGKIADIQIGGRNLFVGTTDDYKLFGGISNIIANVSTLKGQLITLSLYLNNAGGFKYFDLYINGGWREGFVVQTESVGINRLVGTFTVPNDADYMTFSSANTNGACSISKLKLEEGNKATAWTPAPEDTDTKISEMEGRFEIREDQISAKVTEVTRKATEASSSATSAAGSAGTAATKAGEAAKSYQDVVTKQGEINTTAGKITLQVTEVTEKSAAAINAAELAAAMSKGKMLYRDPTFKDGRNSTMQYLSNATSSVIVVAGCPNPESKALRIVATGWNIPSIDHRIGGFYFATRSRANAVFIVRIIANIPVGRQIKNDHNQYGDGGSTRWLTSSDGTGSWTEYACKVTCGASGIFSTTNHVSLSGGIAPSASAPVIWDVAYATVFDVTDVDDVPTRDEIKSGIAITPGGIGIFGEYHSLNGMFTFSSLSQEAQDIINGKATIGYADTAKDAAIIASRNNVAEKMGYINYADMEAKAIAGQSIITGGKIRTILIDADAIVTDALVTRHIDADYIQGKTLNFTKGTIGGWSIDADSLYSGVKAADSTYATLGMTIRSNGSISSKNFRIDKDGNVFGRDCEFTDGRFTGTVTATKGRIGGFEISGGSLVHTTGDTVMVEEHLFLDTTGISFIYRDKNSYTKKEIFAGFGIGSGPSTLGLPVPLWVDHEVKKGATTTICYASFFSARGAADPYNNIAIALGSGCISGLAVKVRIITGSDNISHDDVFIKGSESGTYDPTVTLPWNPTVGKVIITCNGSRKITIAMSSHYIRVNGANHTAMTVGGGTRMAIFIFDGTYWNYNYLNI